ncbi:hypothetical protein CHS0354_004363 [Potamilus streckersoni]|uniref:Uncharacterized protein n=1 Tax=Potamilus streckersoni TaxID=2493646 RepID=A0AAE0SH57_9BIVA|nr:hypothetical protein CHS0354_004363 [Potamilus streckersoni]
MMAREADSAVSAESDEVVAEKYKQDLQSEIEVTKCYVQYLNYIHRDLTSYLDQTEINILQLKHEIESQTVLRDTIERDIEEERTRETDRVNERILAVDNALKKVNDEVDLVVNTLASLNSTNVIEEAPALFKKLRDIVYLLPLIPTDRYIYKLSPTPKSPTDDERSFDKIHVPSRVKVKRIASFKPKECASARFVTSLCPVSESEAWVVWQCGPQIHMVDKDGQLKKTVDTGCKVDDISVDFDGNLVLSCYETKYLKRLNENYEVKQIIQLEFIPRGFRFTSWDEIVVCCVQNIHHQNGDICRLVKINVENDRVVSEFGDPTHFIQPWRIAVNINGDICVSDRNKGTVSIFDPRGKLKATYCGPADNTRHAFAPHALCCDSFGQIFIVDYSNHTVHVLDPLGRFRGFMIMDTELEKRAIFMGTSSPFSIGIDKMGDLWVGNKYGYITVLRYV